MNTFTEIIHYIIETLGTLFLLFVILRFLLQLVRADFYNPFSQAVVKITNPLLLPLRKIIPGLFGIDVSCIVLAIAIQVILGEIIYFVYAQQFINPLQLVIWGALASLNIVTYVFYGAAIIMVVSSFIAPYSSHPIITLARQIMEPLMKPIQNLMPPMGGLDFSVLFVFMGIGIFQMILNGVAQSVGLTKSAALLVIGY